MSAAPKTPHPYSGIKLFTVTAVDGRKVSLHEDWYHVHILARHHEVGWLSDPLESIKHALIRAVEVRIDPRSKRPLYVGPFFTGFGGESCLHIPVDPKGNRGVVMTVMRVFR